MLEKKAFTLAEVLITLGIIGVVAALTLPSLVASNQRKELEIGLKKGSSSISQALELYFVENGERMLPSSVTRTNFKTVLMKYLNSVKDCKLGYNQANSCIPNYGTDNENNSINYKNYNGKSTINLNNFDDGQFILNDGMLVLLEKANDAASRVFISVDVNGYKKAPNKLGQDLFMFQLDRDNGKLLPMGIKGTDYYSNTDEYCSKTSTSPYNGAGCTYKALTEKDYFKNLPR